MVLTLIMIWPAISVSAESAEEKGLSIVREADQREAGFINFIVDVVMTLKNKQGKESERKLRIKVLEAEGDGDKNLVIFDSPKDLKGTAFLNYTHKLEDDDRWLYLPALKRVKRISSRNKSGSFMGSEFAYEDMASQEVEKYTYKWIRDESYKERECFVVEYYPVDQDNSGYTKKITWIDEKEYYISKVDYYDRKGFLLKTLQYSGYQQYSDKYWKPDEMYMVNHQTGKSTKLIWSDYKFLTNLKERDFNKNTLKRAW